MLLSDLYTHRNWIRVFSFLLETSFQKKFLLLSISYSLIFLPYWDSNIISAILLHTLLVQLLFYLRVFFFCQILFRGKFQIHSNALQMKTVASVTLPHLIAFKRLLNPLVRVLIERNCRRNCRIFFLNAVQIKTIFFI